jgi:hypothetical protein
LPYLNYEFAQRQQKVVMNAMALLNKGELTDARAKELWIEMSVLAGLSRSFSTSVQVDSARATKMLNGDDTHG